jgi:predicted nuclease of predicted toxin-antitoxin system
LRILLDNCIPWRLAKSVPGHEVTSVIDLGWDKLRNGRLLDAMTGQFDLLLTVDRSIPFQQHLAGRPFAVVVLRAKTNRLGDLLPLVPAVLRVLADIKPGETREVGI